MRFLYAFCELQATLYLGQRNGGLSSSINIRPEALETKFLWYANQACLVLILRLNQLIHICFSVSISRFLRRPWRLAGSKCPWCPAGDSVSLEAPWTNWKPFLVRFSTRLFRNIRFLIKCQITMAGFNVNLDNDQMIRCLKKAGCFIAGQTKRLVPADRIMSVVASHFVLD